MVRRSKSIAKYSPSDPPRLNTNTTLELDVLALRAKNSELTKTLADCKQDNARLQKTIDYLQRDKFEYETRYNNLKNIVVNIESLLKTSLGQIMGFSENFTGLMQLCNIANSLNVSVRDNPSASSSRQGSPYNNTNRDSRMHIIKPHMVNGHILQIPTIKLTRVSEANLMQTVEHNSSTNNSMSQNEANSSMSEEAQNNRSFKCRTGSYSLRHTRSHIERMDVSELEESLEDDEPLPEIEGEMSETDRLDTIAEENESPQSQFQNRNSTVLSGVFQDVKIYLNQLPLRQSSSLDRLSDRRPRTSRSGISPSYACRPSCSERDTRSLSGASHIPIPSTSRDSVPQHDHFDDDDSCSSFTSDSEAEDEEPQCMNGTAVRNGGTVEKRASPSRKSPDSTFSTNHSGSSISLRQSLEEENANKDLNNSKMIVMKELGLAPSHLANQTSPQSKILRNSGVKNSPTTRKVLTNVTQRKASSKPKSKGSGTPRMLQRLSTDSRLAITPPIKSVSRNEAMITRRLEDRQKSGGPPASPVSRRSSSTADSPVVTVRRRIAKLRSTSSGSLLGRHINTERGSRSSSGRSRTNSGGSRHNSAVSRPNSAGKNSLPQENSNDAIVDSSTPDAKDTANTASTSDNHKGADAIPTATKKVVKAAPSKPRKKNPTKVEDTTASSVPIAVESIKLERRSSDLQGRTPPVKRKTPASARKSPIRKVIKRSPAIQSKTGSTGTIVKRLSGSLSPKKSPGHRPRRAARPAQLKEPSLNRKMRR